MCRPSLGVHGRCSACNFLPKKVFWIVDGCSNLNRGRLRSFSSGGRFSTRRLYRKSTPQSLAALISLSTEQIPFTGLTICHRIISYFRTVVELKSAVIHEQCPYSDLKPYEVYGDYFSNRELRV